MLMNKEELVTYAVCSTPDTKISYKIGKVFIEEMVTIHHHILVGH